MPLANDICTSSRYTFWVFKKKCLPVRTYTHKSRNREAVDKGYRIMVNLLITAGIISLLTATIGVLIALKIQSRVLRRTGIENEAWQHAQEAHQNIWEVKQRKQALELDITLPHIANVRLTDLKPTTAPASIAFDTTIPISTYTGNGRAKAN